MLARVDAWASLDSAVRSGVDTAVATMLDMRAQLANDTGLPPGFVEALQETAAAQVAVFPALIGLASVAALAIAWWARVRLSGTGEVGLGPLARFRFNDHLIWLLVAGLLLMLAQWGDALLRIGSNAVVFMAGLYALRGAAVFVFVSGGMSFLGYVTFAIGMALATPVVVGVAMLIGIGDTWLDLRSRAGEKAA